MIDWCSRGMGDVGGGEWGVECEKGEGAGLLGLIVLRRPILRSLSMCWQGREEEVSAVKAVRVISTWLCLVVVMRESMREEE